MVVALDEPTAAWLEARNVAHYTKVLTSRTGSTDNHATSVAMMGSPRGELPLVATTTAFEPRRKQHG